MTSNDVSEFSEFLDSLLINILFVTGTYLGLLLALTDKIPDDDILKPLGLFAAGLCIGIAISVDPVSSRRR